MDRVFRLWKTFKALSFLLAGLYKMIMVSNMEDNSGKKFSLQDWVMKRAANQSGSAAPQISARQILSEMEFSQNEEDTEQKDVRIETHQETSSVEVEMKAVSNGSTISSAPSAPSPVRKEDAKEAVAFSPNQNPLQQLQVVRLLTDLADRLRQSEKEREILWKEVEICRKQISDMGGREGKNEKSYAALEAQLNQREVFVKELVEKQIGLEQKLKAQLDDVEISKKEQAKLQEKLTSIETAAGSAIVRIEDAISENSKLSKKVEQLTQDKQRLSRKLETVEETLTLTQDILKAKALVLLTDQSVAAKTNMLQTPAWTGDDTLKVSAAAPAAPTKFADVIKKEPGLVSDLAASLRKKKPSFKIRTSTAILSGVVVLGIIGGIFGNYFIQKFQSVSDPILESGASSENLIEPEAGNNQDSVSAHQDDLMAQAAKIANQIEPSSVDPTDDIDSNDVPVKDAVDGVLPEDFESAQVAQEKAVADFNKAAPAADSDILDRIAMDKSLPKSIAAIQERAFNGDANAQHDLAAIYTAGHAGVKVNYATAAKWFSESAHNGVGNAQYNLGVLYHQGLGVKKDTAKALQLYRVAASNGHPEAQYNLAISYVEGVGVEYNPQIASVYFEQAAEGGIVEAAYNLGLLHENGLLGESQPDEAIFWYTLSADKGNKDAAKALDNLKSQLGMSDEDAARVAQKIANQNPAFLNDKGGLSLPEEKSSSKPPEISAEKPKPSAQSAAKPSAVSAAAVDPVVVSQIQEQLVRLGLYKGSPDGTMTAAVSQSIKTYQQKNGLKVDGKPSDDLLVHMLASGVEALKTVNQTSFN